MPEQGGQEMNLARRPSRYRNVEPAAVEPPKRMEMEDIDSILDGVDAILEENECAVLRSFRQRGGE